MKFRAELSIAGKVIKTHHYEDGCSTMADAVEANSKLNQKFARGKLTKLMHSEVFAE